jgi:DNA-binding MarR family transcriptional regulator
MAKSFDLGTSPSHLLRRANQFANDLYTDEDEADGLTQRQLAVLYAIDQNDTMSQTELVRATGIDRSTLADMIVRMQKRELIARRRTEKDQRANAVRITTVGKRALRAAMPAMQRAEAAILDALPVRSRPEFLKCLSSLAQTHADKLAEDETNGKKKKRARR